MLYDVIDFYQAISHNYLNSYLSYFSHKNTCDFYTHTHFGFISIDIITYIYIDFAPRLVN